MLNEKAREVLKEELKNHYKYRETGYTDEEFEKEALEKYKSVLGPVPARYKHITKDSLSQEMHDKLMPGEDKNGLYIWGGVGSGKTATLYSIKDRFARAGKRFRVINMTELLYEIKNSFNQEAPPLDIVEEGAYYTAFDDLGTEKDSEWAGEQVYRLVNSIYENKKNFAFTSKFSLKELAGRYGDHRDRIASRIAEMAEVIEVKGTDRRL